MVYDDCEDIEAQIRALAQRCGLSPAEIRVRHVAGLGRLGILVRSRRAATVYDLDEPTVLEEVKQDFLAGWHGIAWSATEEGSVSSKQEDSADSNHGELYKAWRDADRNARDAERWVVNPENGRRELSGLSNAMACRARELRAVANRFLAELTGRAGPTQNTPPTAAHDAEPQASCLPSVDNRSS